MFLLQVFGHFDFPLKVLGQGAIPKTMELGWQASMEMGACSILLDGILSSSKFPQENAHY